MANALFDSPPALQGDEQNQLTQMYRYLMAMSDQLNEAMNGITLANFAPETQTQIRTAISGGGSSQELKETKNALRSMVIKSAEIIEQEMQEISTKLQSQYTGISDQFGQLDQKLTNTIQANAAGIRQNYEYIERLAGRADSTESYIIHSNQYIYTGLIGYDAANQPVYGVAIGENVTQYDEDGNPYINDNAKVATFTKDRLSFWQGTTEMAYFSNRKMYITNCEILSTLTMGRYEWRIQADGSMGLVTEMT